MRIQCKSCQQEFGEPRIAGGFNTLLPAAILGSTVCRILYTTIDRLAHHFTFIICIALWSLVAWIYWKVPVWYTQLRYRGRKCPNCGAQTWARPHYSGFGLGL